MYGKIHSISDPKLRVDILTRQDVEKIHTATLDILEHVGVRFPSGKALDLFAEHGAEVDRQSMIVRLPGTLVEDYLAKAPSAYTLAGCTADYDLPLDGNHSYLGTDGCGVEIVDVLSGEKRRATRQDLMDVGRVADYLDGIAFHWVPLSAQDCPPETRSLHELNSIWSVSRKHVQTEEIVTDREMAAAIEMAAVLAGGKEALRQRPLLSIMQCTLSPLCQDGGSVEAALVAARAGLPVGFMTMASCLTTGPVTPAGTLVVGNAEVLSALVLMQMASPGCPVYYAAAQTASDLRTGGYTGGGPVDYLFGAATNLLADYYHLPLSMGAFATGAKEPGWQSAIDNTMSALMAVSTGADMLLGAGLLHGSRIFAYDMLLMDVEIWEMLRSMFRGIGIDENTLALDAIRDVGPGGNYLEHSHTLRNMRNLWQPSLMDRRPYQAWLEKRDGPRDWALEKARLILNTHHPEPLEMKTRVELDKIIQKCEMDWI